MHEGRDSGAAERGQVHGVQQLDAGGCGGPELPVHDHRPEPWRGHRTGRASGRAGGGGGEQEGRPGDGGLRGHRRARARGEQGRGTGEPVPRAHPGVRRHSPRGAVLRGRERGSCPRRRRPGGDVEIVNTELLLADLATVERRLERTGRAAKSGDPKLKAEVGELEGLRDHLSGGAPARACPGSEALGMLITAKPTLYVANVDEESVVGGNGYSSEVEKLAEDEGAEAVRISAKLEAEVAELPEDEAREYLDMLGVKTTGFEEFVRAAYRALGVITFFTFNEKECRAWTVKEGSTARRAAGRIHTDMERGFIAAEVGGWEDVVAAGFNV